MLADKLRAASSGVSNPAWNLSKAVYQGSPINFFYVGDQDTTPAGIFFKSDGLKMYVVGNGGDAVYEYDLSTAWDISTASYLQNFSIAAQETSPSGIFFKPDGTKMYVSGAGGDDVNEYDLSTAWNVTTASYLQSFSFSAQDLITTGIFFKPDGLKLYVVGQTSDAVYEYDLSTAWNVSTASYLRSFSVAAQETSPNGIFFKSDGTKMYIVGAGGDDVNEYTLSTAWNVTTASYIQIFSVAVQEGSPGGLFFKSDGTKMYVSGAGSDTVHEYDLSTAWNVSTASFTYPASEYFYVAAQEANPSGIFFKSDGTKMYMIGLTNDTVYEYDLSTAWSINTASYLQSFSVAAQEGSPLGIFFKPDGLKMYVIGTVGADVNEYTLSTAWNVTTASYIQSFSVSAQQGSPTSVFFKPDGLKMYITGGSGTDSVWEYDLSTAWNVSTASYLQSFVVQSQDGQTRGLFFKPDGLKMYTAGADNDAVNEFNLSTAWDVSTATYVQNFSVVAQERTLSNIFFKPDGLKMYVIGVVNDAVWSYDFV